MASVLEYTVLSLERYRIIFGINPLSFWGAASPDLFPPNLECSRVWSKYLYQQPDQASRQNLVESLRDAEEAIAEFIGFRPAPIWINGVTVPYPKTYGKWHTNGRNFTGHQASVYSNVGSVITGGVRGVTEMGTDLPLVYADADGDSWDEYATVDVTKPIAPEVIPASQDVRIFYSGHGGDAREEIRGATLLSEDALIWTFRIDSWLLFRPELHETLPGREGFTPIDAADAGNFVATVDAYYVYNDNDTPPGTLLWEEEGSEPVSQPAFLEVKEQDNGLIIPHPARYDEDNLVWVDTEFARPYSPDRVSMNLYAGKLSNDYLMGLTRDPLPNTTAQAIAYLATARLSRDICECNSELDDLATDFSFVSPQGNFLAIADTIQNNPWGSRKGEVLAYRLMQNTQKRYGVALL